MSRILRTILRYTLYVSLVLVFSQFSMGVIGADQAQARKEKVRKIKAPKARKRPSLSFRPDVSRQSPKYIGKLGVLKIRDRRGLTFYGGSDEFFREPVLEALNNALYLNLKASRVFSQVVPIEVQPGARFTRTDLKALAQQYGLDYVLLSDLTAFTMLREKMVARKKGIDFKVMVRFGLFSQLIEPNKGAILWAEPVIRQMGQLNAKKKTKASDYGNSAVQAAHSGLNDLSTSIRLIGLEVRR
ncbi:MAG: hypothetical protein Q9M33_02590 [Robiginitomaculum sp.]|nr:hypothetical protein [Robiginitomaculum sp.]MDQ7077255.1 hypothetical protein [Robiginitomaculum sp.]